MDLDHAISTLETTLEAPESAARHQQIATCLRDIRSLMTEPLTAQDGWLVARAEHEERERVALVERMEALGPEPSQDTLRRLATDLAHYRHRVVALDYDAVEMELGGFD